ncbi:MAG: radical SAM protein [Myxococcales bacterium]|nr:radical SAM protein [Myxococcales bacterium]
MIRAEPRRLQVVSDIRPLLVVWETTLRCDQHCRFCGTRAGKSHPNELSTAEMLDVVAQLRDAGTAEIAVHGGEAYLRKDFLELVRAIRSRGIECTMVTGGRGITPELADGLRDADITAVSVSVDGLEATHDHLRGLAGSHRGALRALELLHERGVAVGCNTQVNRRNFRELESIVELAAARGVYGWQVQLMVPMGRAAEAEDLWLEPHDILEVMPRIALARRRADELGVKLWPGNNVGYFGPYEHLLRADRTRQGFSSGCGGGIRTMGIEANGDVKGCSAMASKGFVGGNVREQPIREIWDHAPELQFTRGFVLDDLWGFCRSCYYAETCKGGCIWTSSTLLGRVGNNPYCHHRALELLAAGKRERLCRVGEAPGENRDTASFELVLESAPADWVASLPALV